MKFLAVDDEPLALQDLEDILREAMPECRISGFPSARQALSYAQEQPFDAAFLDIELGAANGIVLAKQLKDIWPDVHIIFVTSHSQYAVEAFAIHATGYLLKPIEVEDIKRELTFLYGEDCNPHKHITVRTFGGFSVFADGRPVVFKRAKAKELFAYLIDRAGCGVTTREACAVLWEDVPYDKSQKNYFQTIVTDLKNTLREIGAEDILVKSRNSIAVAAEKINCDCYRFMQGDPKAINSYRSNYMVNYSWAEFSVGNLENTRYGLENKK